MSPFGWSRVRVLALVSLVALSGCARQPGTPTAAPAVRRPDEILEDLQMTETSSGSRSWVLHARKAYVYDAENRVDVEVAAVDFYDDTGKQYSHLTCDRGSLNQSSNDMRAEGHVEIRTTSGMHVESELLCYWNGPQRITSDRFVKVTDAHGSVLSGTGFESDVRVEHYRVGKVDATLRHPGGEGSDR
ncbi:MAG TPA: LPS export ABC transporter periplasmic protein LptC [Candidatus Saccharimonadales bacterium]|nr:LPS export ABC transporter periplasmic protein LptC [Candidatus Saccharimonadales bacterium]